MASLTPLRRYTREVVSSTSKKSGSRAEGGRIAGLSTTRSRGLARVTRRRTSAEAKVRERLSLRGPLPPLLTNSSMTRLPGRRRRSGACSTATFACSTSNTFMALETRQLHHRNLSMSKVL